MKIKNKILTVLMGLGLTACGPNAPAADEYGQLIFEDDFTQDGGLQGYTVNNESALPKIQAQDGRYYAPVFDNPNDVTLHFNQKQGRLDAQKVTFPFTVVVRNIGIGLIDDSQAVPPHAGEPYIFAGVQVHTQDLNERTSAHVVVGHRGNHYSTVEGKNTLKGYSWVTDVGQNKVPDARADLLIQGLPDKTLKVFWQPPNLTPDATPDRWIAYNGQGHLPGDKPTFTDEVYVGLITYAAGDNGIPFVGTADSWHLYKKD